MGDPLVLSRADRIRFGVGIASLFASTLIVALAAIALLPTVVPGWHSTVVGSGSMQPALRRGDVVIARRSDADAVSVGSVVVFESDRGGSIVHRVVDVADDRSLVTRGDANAAPDSGTVADEQLVGTGFAAVPWVGLPRLWWMEGARLAVVLLLVGTIAAAIASRWATVPAATSPAPAPPATSWLSRSAPQGTGRLLDDRRAATGGER